MKDKYGMQTVTVLTVLGSTNTEVGTWVQFEVLKFEYHFDIHIQNVSIKSSYISYVLLYYSSQGNIVPLTLSMYHNYNYYSYQYSGVVL